MRPTSGEEERALVAAIDEGYIQRITERLSSGGEVVAGTAESLRAAQWLAEEMKVLGLAPGASGGDCYLEDVTIFGWEELETTVTVLAPEQRSLPCKQNYKGDGTDPAGVTAPVVYLGEGRWEDFESNEVRGKIILFHRTEALFWGNPVLLEARARGAVGALMDWPLMRPTELKTDCIANSVPTAYIRGVDAQWIADELDTGREVRVRLVVHNRTGHYPKAHNVLGVLPGAAYPDECLYLAAHFDHWFAGACDDCAGVGALLGVAKAFRDAGVSPNRTLVFALFDTEELGAPNDTWYDWIMGSYSHAVATLREDGSWGPPLHPELPGRAVAMLNLDVVGARCAEVFCETSPELTCLMKEAADHVQLSSRATTHVYWPPGSYDDASFFIAGIPATQTAWFGPIYDALYHTTDDTLNKIDWENVRLTAAFTLVAAARLAQPPVLPYDLRESACVAGFSMERLLSIHPELEGDPTARLDELRRDVDGYLAAVERFERASLNSLDEGSRVKVNQAYMKATKALGTTLFSWDMTDVPGWDNITLFETSAHDMRCLEEALDHLEAANRGAAAEALADVRTMAWGREVSARAYADVLATIAYPTNPVWGGPFIPFLTQVHEEYESLVGRSPGDEAIDREVVTSLERKVGMIRSQIGELSAEAAEAFRRAADALREGAP